MSKSFWRAGIAIACIIWGAAVLFFRHHLSDLIPFGAGFLLAYGTGLLLVFFRHRRRTS